MSDLKKETRAILDLEQSIMDCWSVTTAVDELCESLMDSPDYESLDCDNLDEVSNILLGIRAIWDMKFKKCFTLFERVAKHLHTSQQKQAEQKPTLRFDQIDAVVITELDRLSRRADYDVDPEIYAAAETLLNYYLSTRPSKLDGGRFKPTNP